MLDIPEIYQQDLNKFRQSFGELFRRFYCLNVSCGHNNLAATTALGNIIAEGVNATLIAPGHPQYIDDGRFPMYYPGLQQEGSPERTIGAVWNKYFGCAGSERAETPEFVKIPLLNFNFIYCAQAKRKYESVFDFTIFTDPFDMWIWLSLSVALVLVAMVAFSNFSNKYKTFQTAVLPSVGALLSPGESGARGRSMLFTLWMLTCSVLVTTYSGNMTSEVISPSQEDTIENMQQLKEENYGLIFGSKVWFLIVKMTAKSIATAENFIHKDLVVLGDIVRKRNIRLYDSPQFLKELSSCEENVASITLWPLAIRMALDASSLIKFDVDNFRRNRLRKCNVGKTLIKFGEVFFAFTPPGSLQLRRIFQSLVESGIAYRWLQEFEEVSYSNRVQDRGKVKSPTNIVQSDGNTFEPLDLEGKTVTIFLLWIGCLCCSLVCFICEILTLREG